MLDVNFLKCNLSGILSTEDSFVGIDKEQQMCFL